METRLRMLLVMKGLPRPEAQVTIRDRFLRTLGRIDLFYRDQRLGLEYDGATHEGSLAEDNRRQNRLVDAGIRLLRFTAGDIYSTPEDVVRQVRAALTA
jgi:very-short-patch-repair endonuclease